MSDRDWQDESIEQRVEARKREFRFPAFMPFFWLGLASIAGTLLADTLKLPWYWWAGLVILGLLSILVEKRRQTVPQTQKKLPLGVLISVLSLSAMLYQLSLPESDTGQLLNFHGKGDVSVTGIVDTPPEAKSASLEVVVGAEKVRLNGISYEVEGRIIFYVPLGSQLEYGDRVEIWGELEKPDEGQDFFWREYLEHKGIYSTTQFPQVKVIQQAQGNHFLALLYRLRDHGNQVLTQIFPSPEDALLRGILLGDESGISRSMEAAYRKTGTSHIIAISGFNMAVLAGLVSLFFTRQLGARRGAVATILLLLGYSLLVGGSPSVLRAAFMGAFAVIGGVIARRGNTLNSLGLSALVMILINPHLPWDLGFQFSFLATLGLALFAGPVQLRVEDWFKQRFEEMRATFFASLISEFLLLTLIAQAMVLPISVWHFHEVSWLFLIANPLILPLQPAVMVLGLLAMTAGMLSLPVGKVLSWLAWPWAALTNWIVLSLAKIPTQVLSLPQFNLFWVILYYLILFLIVFRPKTNQLFKNLLQPQFALLGLSALTAVVWLVAARAPDGKAHILLPQQAEQSFALITLTDGKSILLSGSAGEESLVDMVSGKLPLFSNRLEVLLIPDCRRAQLTGLFPVAQKFAIGQTFWLCDPESNQTSRNLYASLEERGFPQQRLSEDLAMQSGKLKLQVRLVGEEFKELVLDHKTISLLLVPLTESGKATPIAANYGAKKTGFAVLVNCEACLAQTPATGEEQMLTKTQIFWQELTSDGENLFFASP